MSDATEGLGLPQKPDGRSPIPPAATSTARPAMPSGMSLASPAAPGVTPAAPITLGAKPPERRPEGPTPIMPTPRRDSEQRRLIVGREISLTGEITSCERLIVEGSVEANLTNCREVEIAETGLLKGTAAIEEAEIRGRFEGTLTVRKRLFIKSTGRVTGLVRYGQLEVECGGQISGDVQAQVAGAAEDEVRAPRPLAMAGEMKA